MTKTKPAVGALGLLLAWAPFVVSTQVQMASRRGGGEATSPRSDDAADGPAPP